MLTIYNTLTNQKEKFIPLHKGEVSFYSCGPTVYDYAHIGNLRTYLLADVLKRVLELNGYKVKHVMNITDVGHLTADDIGQADAGDDKMLKAMKRERKTPEAIASFYEKAFRQDIEKLNIEKANFYPRATEHVAEMIKIIQTLLKKGYAYEKNGNVFYDVDKFKKYGRLSNKNLSELKHGARLEDHPDKKHPYDFALWLKAPKDHLLQWDSPWGKGYPGWHIECSAMSMRYLGKTLDIHSGGEDNIFPHHENEIAQSEAYSGETFANFWVHPRHLLVDGKKMSKSAGNFYTLADIVEKGYSPMAFRLLVLGSHYRSNLNFTWTSLQQAEKNLQKIETFLREIKKMAEENKVEVSNLSERERNEFLKISIGNVKPKHCLDKFVLAVNDDLNTPLALSLVYRFIKEVRKVPRLTPEQIKAILVFWEKVNKVLGLKFDFTEKDGPKKIPATVKLLLEKREKARQQKNFPLADELRKKIEKKGYLVEDTPEGTVVRNKM